MNAITLWQPWATWVDWTWKTIETRRHSRFACLVGQRIAIHAGKRWDETALVIAGPWLDAARFDRTIKTWGRPSGAVLGTALVQAHRTLGDGDSAQSLCDCSAVPLHGLVLVDYRPLAAPVPATGSQGIWTWNPPSGAIS